MKKLILTALFLILTVAISFAGSPAQYPLFQAIDADGNPVSGGLVYTYKPGTTTAKTAYTDEALTVPATNPIVLDSKGEAQFYYKGNYKIDVKTSAGVQVDGFPVDNLRGQNDGAAQDNYYPDYTEADQGVTGDNNTLKYYIDTIGSDQATIVLRHNSGSATTTYTLTTSETIPANITLKVERGAVIDGAGTLTFADDVRFVNDNSQAFGSSITIVNLPETTPELWGVDGTGDEVEINKALIATAGECKLGAKTYTISTANPISIPSSKTLSGIPGITKIVPASTMVTIVEGVTSATKIVLRGVWVYGTGALSTVERGFYNITGTDVLVENCRFENVSFGVQFQGVTRGNILNNTFVDITGTAGTEFGMVF